MVLPKRQSLNKEWLKTSILYKFGIYFEEKWKKLIKCKINLIYKKLKN